MIYYKLRKDQLYKKEIGEYEAYGIEAQDENGNIIRCIYDISFEKEPLEELVEDCNELELDIIHLDDVIDDFFVPYSF